jgi:hypothetical protein
VTRSRSAGGALGRGSIALIQSSATASSAGRSPIPTIDYLVGWLVGESDDRRRAVVLVPMCPYCSESTPHGDRQFGT